MLLGWFLKQILTLSETLSSSTHESVASYSHDNCLSCLIPRKMVIEEQCWVIILSDDPMKLKKCEVKNVNFFFFFPPAIKDLLTWVVPLCHSLHSFFICWHLTNLITANWRRCFKCCTDWIMKKKLSLISHRPPERYNVEPQRDAKRPFI